MANDRLAIIMLQLIEKFRLSQCVESRGIAVYQLKIELLILQLQEAPSYTSLYNLNRHLMIIIHINLVFSTPSVVFQFSWWVSSPSYLKQNGIVFCNTLFFIDYTSLHMFIVWFVLVHDLILLSLFFKKK